MMAHYHVNSIRQSTDDFNGNELSRLLFNHDCEAYHSLHSGESQSEALLGVSSHDLKTTATHVGARRGFLGEAHRRAQKLRRLAFRLRRAGLPRYRIEKMIEAKRHEI